MTKNCIFLCVFHNPKYLHLLQLLLHSIELYGNMSSDTSIVIYTCSEFEKIIHNFSFSFEIVIVIHNEYKTVEQSCRARLDLFNIPYIQHCERILYLDTDILIINDIAPIFNLCQSDHIYALEEGTMKTHDPYWDYYGKTLFTTEEVGKYEHRTAFSSGIMLFPNTQKIKSLFRTISRDIKKRPICKFDQPYIVHHALKQNMIDNQSLIPYAILFNDYNILPPQRTMTFIHFAGGVGVYQHKAHNMLQFLQQRRNSTCILRVMEGRFMSWMHDLNTETLLDVLGLLLLGSTCICTASIMGKWIM